MFYRSTFITLSRHASESLTTHWYDFFTDISVCNRCEIAEQSEWGKKCGKSLLFRPGRKKNNVKFYKFFFFVVKAFLFSMRLVWAAWKRDADIERVWRLPEAWELAIVQKVKVDFFSPLGEFYSPHLKPLGPFTSSDPTAWAPVSLCFKTVVAPYFLRADQKQSQVVSACDGVASTISLTLNPVELFGETAWSCDMWEVSNCLSNRFVGSTSGNIRWIPKICKVLSADTWLRLITKTHF